MSIELVRCVLKENDFSQVLEHLFRFCCSSEDIASLLREINICALEASAYQEYILKQKVLSSKKND